MEIIIILIKMCNCKNIKIGSYGNQVLLPCPDHMYPLKNVLGETKKVQAICIDACLSLEIQELWSKGITTTGCCCGHNNKELAFIGVIAADIVAMKGLGYIQRGDNFIPKSLNSIEYGNSNK